MLIKLLLIIYFILVSGNIALKAQAGGTTGNDSDKASKASSCDTLGQKDFRDVIGSVLRLKFKPDSTKYKGNGPFLSVVPVVGYSLQSGLTGALTTSTSFYASSRHEKFSSILANLYSSEYHQTWFVANSNIFLDKPKLHFFGDWRYYNFPTNTFGIGNRSSLNDALAIDYSYIRFYQHAFLELADNIFVGAGYNLDDHWNIQLDSDSGKVYNEIRKFQKGTSSLSSGLSLNFQYDNRKNSVNADQGSFASIQYRSNMMFLGSDNNWQSLVLDARHYQKFPASTSNVLAFWYYANMTLAGKPPYLDLPSIGWDDYSNTGRGYVPGRYTGRNLLYLESEYRFGITRNKLLGGVLFGNAESLLRKIPGNLHTVIPGYGCGLRVKLNKFSNTNLAVDYGFGIGGSRGFFFNLGEVF